MIKIITYCITFLLTILIAGFYPAVAVGLTAVSIVFLFLMNDM